MTKNYEEFTRDALLDLQSRNLPPMRGTDLFTPKEDASDETAAAELAKADEYLKAFVFGERSPTGRRCICCSATLTGMFGSFAWGLAYGEGSCEKCGYPGRAIHEIDGVGKINLLVLQYHPSQLRFEERRAEDAG